MPQHKSLNGVLAAIEGATGAGGAGAVAARVALRTGVNLRSPKPGQASDPATVEKVCACLREMGYTV